MNSCISNQDCICRRYQNRTKGCINEFSIEDSGKKIQLTKRAEDDVLAIILDGCLMTDNNTKCDALFLFQNLNKKISFLIELKGFGDIEKAFMQLEYTKNHRLEYKQIIDCFKSLDNKKVKEHFIIVTNGILDKIQKEKYEEQYRIRVKAVLNNDATKKIPNLRDYI